MCSSDLVADKKAKESQTKKQVKKIQDNLEKTTLGDIEELAKLKSEMDANEAKPAKTKKAASNDDESNDTEE